MATYYVTKETEREIKDFAMREGLSQSKAIAALVLMGYALTTQLIESDADWIELTRKEYDSTIRRVRAIKNL